MRLHASGACRLQQLDLVEELMAPFQGHASHFIGRPWFPLNSLEGNASCGFREEYSNSLTGDGLLQWSGIKPEVCGVFPCTTHTSAAFTRSREYGCVQAGTQKSEGTGRVSTLSLGTMPFGAFQTKVSWNCAACGRLSAASGHRRNPARWPSPARNIQTGPECRVAQGASEPSQLSSVIRSPPRPWEPSFL